MKPTIPKGTRDFSPTEVAKRNYIFNTIKSVFETFGFQPIETPSFENSSTLMGKYGDEGDRLIFKILDSGEYFKSLNSEFNKYREFYEQGFFFYEKMLEKAKELFNKYKEISPKIPESIKENRFKEELGNELFRVLSHRKYVNYVLDKSVKRYEFLTKHFETIKHRFTTLAYDKVYLKVDNDEILNIFLFNIYKTFGFKETTKKISEKALRYDLTVPFARYVVQHQNDIVFPFKRYQMQPVWRADRPQKGRFREFYQCDADVVGSKSLWQEIEFVQLYDSVFTKLGLTDTIIKLNNRKILSGIAEIIGEKDKLIDFTVALDKLDKIGAEGVTSEMLHKGISQEAIEKVKPLFSFSGDNIEKLDKLKELLSESEEGTQGVEDLKFVIENIEKLGLSSARLEIDVTLARGLNYYTGAIYEVQTDKVAMGSIGGGGRYDDLTGIFGLKNISGIGISFGLDRIYLVLEELNLFKKVDLPKPTVVFINFGENEAGYSMQTIKKLREIGIKSELYPDNAKLKKQMIYANKRKIPFVVLVGEQEMQENKFTLKNMQTGEQTLCNFDDLTRLIN